MNHTTEDQPSVAPAIRVAAGVITDKEGRILLVRKRGTEFFMQPGGKLRGGETPFQALTREVMEELGCTLVQPEFLGTFFAAAANEPLETMEALLFRATIAGDAQPAAEIAEMVWVEPSLAGTFKLAPLTSGCVLPLILSKPAATSDGGTPCLSASSAKSLSGIKRHTNITATK